MVVKPEDSQADQLGFNAAMLRWRGERMEWPDKELLHFLQSGCYEYSDDIPPVS